MQGNARRSHMPRQRICWISRAERRPLRKAQHLLSGAAGLMAKVYADVLLALEEECGIMVSKRNLRDLIVEASGAETKQNFDCFLLELFGDGLSDTLRSQLHNAFHHITAGKFSKSSSRKPKPVAPGSWCRSLKAERAYEGRATHL